MVAEYLSRGRQIQALREQQSFTACKPKKSPPPGEAGHVYVGSEQKLLAVTSLFVVLGFVDVTILLIQILMQIDPLGTSQLAIGFVGTLELPNITLLASERSGLTARQLAGSDALLNALPLILLTGIDAGVPIAGLGAAQAAGADEARE
jgi:hypothetical protein